MLRNLNFPQVNNSKLWETEKERKEYRRDNLNWLEEVISLLENKITELGVNGSIIIGEKIFFWTDAAQVSTLLYNRYFKASLQGADKVYVNFGEICLSRLDASYDPKYKEEIKKGMKLIRL